MNYFSKKKLVDQVYQSHGLVTGGPQWTMGNAATQAHRSALSRPLWWVGAHQRWGNSKRRVWGSSVKASLINVAAELAWWRNPLGVWWLGAREGDYGGSTVLWGQQDGASSPFIGSWQRGKASGKRRRSAGDGKSLASILIQNREGGETLGRCLMKGKEVARMALRFNFF
jgi:hypothetical protein